MNLGSGKCWNAWNGWTEPLVLEDVSPLIPLTSPPSRVLREHMYAELACLFWLSVQSWIKILLLSPEWPGPHHILTTADTHIIPIGILLLLRNLRWCTEPQIHIINFCLISSVVCISFPSPPTDYCRCLFFLKLSSSNSLSPCILLYGAIWSLGFSV